MCRFLVVVGMPQLIDVGLESPHLLGCLLPGCRIPQARLIRNLQKDLVDSIANRIGLVLRDEVIPQAAEHLVPELLLVLLVGDLVEPVVGGVLVTIHLYRRRGWVSEMSSRPSRRRRRAPAECRETTYLDRYDFAIFINMNQI